GSTYIRRQGSRSPRRLNSSAQADEALRKVSAEPATQERTSRTFIAPCAPEPGGVRSARRPGAQRVRTQPATWGGFRYEQAVGAAATGDRSRSKGGFMGRARAIAALGRVTNWSTLCGAAV